MNQSLESPSTTSESPSAIFEDWIQLGFNASCLVIGLPLNLITLGELINRYRKTGNRISLLYIHLNLSDLMVIVFYSLTRFCWLLTYQWYGGDALCRLFRFADSVSFAISSYVIVCIGLDRTYAMKRPLRAASGAREHKMLWVAWLCAIVVSLPQFALWQLYEPQSMKDFKQCVSVWIARADEFNNGVMPPLDLLQFRLYSIYHILIVFWIPFLLLIISYSMTLRAVVRRHSNGSVLSVDNSRRSFRKSKPHKKVSTQSVLFMVGHDNSASNRRHTLCPHDDYEGLRQMSGHARLRKARNRTMQVSVTLILIYLCCWLPYNTLSWWRIIDPDSYAIVENTFYFLNGLVVLNSVFNPLIYGRTHLMDFPRRIMRKERNHEAYIF